MKPVKVKLRREAGFAQASKLKGGILRWIDAVARWLPDWVTSSLGEPALHMTRELLEVVE